MCLSMAPRSATWGCALVGCQPRHQLPLLSLWHPAETDGCAGRGPSWRGLLPRRVSQRRRHAVKLESQQAGTLGCPSRTQSSGAGQALWLSCHRVQHAQALTHRATEPLCLGGPEAVLRGGRGDSGWYQRPVLEGQLGPQCGWLQAGPITFSCEKSAVNKSH